MQQKKRAKLKDEADRVGAKVLEKLLHMSAHRRQHKRFSGFPLRFGMLKHVFKGLLSQQPAKPIGQLTHRTSQDRLNKCYDRQDLHLHHLHEIMCESELPKHKVWNIPLPKAANFKKLIQKSENVAPISHRSVIKFPLEDESETRQDKCYPENTAHYPYWKNMM